MDAGKGQSKKKKKGPIEQFPPVFVKLDRPWPGNYMILPIINVQKNNQNILVMLHTCVYMSLGWCRKMAGSENVTSKLRKKISQKSHF